MIDYVIMSPELFPSIHYFEVLEFDSLFSDIHCPVAFTINMKSQENVILPNEENLVTDVNNEHRTFTTWKPESRLDSIDLLCFCSVLCLLCLCARKFTENLS